MSNKFDYINEIHKKKILFLNSLSIQSTPSFFFNDNSEQRRLRQEICNKTTYFEHEKFEDQFKKNLRLRAILFLYVHFVIRVFKYSFYSLWPAKQLRINIINCFGFEYLMKKNSASVLCYFEDLSIKWGGNIVVGFLGNHSSRSKLVTFYKDPLFLLISSIPFFSFSRIKLLFYVLVSLLEYTKNIFTDRCYSFLFKDYALAPFIKIASEMSLIDNYAITTSDFSEQLLPLTDLRNKTFKLHYINYSVNHFNLTSNSCAEVFEHPSYYYLQADVAWCWNDIQSRWFKSITQVKSTIISGPVLFLTQNITTNISRKKKVMIFDVTPRNESWFRRTIGNEGEYFYYNNAICSKFITDITTIAKKHIEIEFQIKSKRSFGLNHCVKYIKLLKNSVSDNIELIQSDVNLLEQIISADIVLSIPYSSPTFLAQYYGIKSAFYDPTGILGQIGTPNDCLLINNITDLEKFIIEKC